MIDVNGRYVTVIGSHFGLQIEEQEQCVNTVCQLIDASDYPVVLMGDFNVTPEDPVLLPIRERLKDSAELPEANLATFPSDAPKTKIDYVLLSKDLIMESASIPTEVVSDHLPIVVQIRF